MREPSSAYATDNTSRHTANPRTDPRCASRPPSRCPPFQVQAKSLAKSRGPIERDDHRPGHVDTAPYPHALEHWSTRATTPHVRAIWPPTHYAALRPRRGHDDHFPSRHLPTRANPIHPRVVRPLKAKPHRSPSRRAHRAARSSVWDRRHSVLRSCPHVLIPSCPHALMHSSYCAARSGDLPHPRTTHHAASRPRRGHHDHLPSRHVPARANRMHPPDVRPSSSSHIVRQVSGLHRAGRSSDRQRRQSPHALIPSCTRALVLLRRTFGRSGAPRTTQRRALDEDTTTTFRRDTSPQERIECTRAMSALSSSSHIVRQVAGLHRAGRSSDRKRRQSPHALIPSCTRALVLLRRTFGRSVPPRTTQRRALHEDTTTTFRRDTSPQERIECTRAMSALSSSRCTARSIGDREHAEPSTRWFTLPHRARWNLESTRAPSPRTEHTQPSSRDSRVRTPRSARAPTR